MLQKLCGGVSTVFLKGFHVPPAGIFVNGRILIKLFSLCLADQTAGGDKFYVNLNALSGMGHLLIRFGDIPGVRELLSHNPLFFQKAVKTGNGAFIAALHEFDPENNQTGMGVAPAHILDKFDFFRGMLVGMGMRTSGAVTKGVPGTVITVLPSVNILAVGLVFSGSVGNAVAFGICNK